MTANMLGFMVVKYAALCGESHRLGYWASRRISMKFLAVGHPANDQPARFLVTTNPGIAPIEEAHTAGIE